DSDDESGSESDDGFADFDDKLASEAEDTPGSKRKGTESDAPSKRKKKEKVPLFGSLDDYAHLIDSTDGLE
ncbi:hypothetical protein EV180_001623, partial [Coemansia sp. RSA 518]